MALRTYPCIIRFVSGTLMILTTIFASTAKAGSLQIAWDPVNDTRVAGYKVKYGTTSKNYTNSVNVGLSTMRTLENLVEGTTYYPNYAPNQPFGLVLGA